MDNTSDLNKPISTAVQAALNLKADSSSNCTKIPLYNKTTLLKTISCVVSSQTTILTTTCTPTYATFCDYRQMTTCTLF
ncbi:TPA: hypothetical protein DEG21_04910 [Patescibacteria group bacterium]|nr:hypothetical protein [Candidatus Gracilibacteria bacterium]HBY75170.1 hypothetical protein [Candidatus Gracilibacteria bacterium]